MALNKVNKEKEFIRTSPITVYDIGEWLEFLNKLADTKGDGYRQIDISWIEDAVQKKLEENAYSAYEEMSAPVHPYTECAYGNGWCIGISFDGYAVRSKDAGATWTESRISATDDSFSAICYQGTSDPVAESKFVALTSKGKGYYSDDDGVTWKAITSLPVNTYSGIAYGNGVFIACADNGKIVKSNDGLVSWKEISIENNQWTDICSDGETQFMLVSKSGTKRSYYSCDTGLSWVGITTTENLEWRSVAYAPFCRTFAMCGHGGTNRIAYMQLPEDFEGTSLQIQALSWTAANSPDSTSGSGWDDIEASHNVFSCVSATNNTYKACSSYNGKEWTGVLTPEGYWHTVTRTDKFFIAFSGQVEADGQMIMRSSNGGLTAVLFATLDEAIAGNEPSKAISAQVLKEWFLSHLPLEKAKGGTGRTDGMSAGIAKDDDVVAYTGTSSNSITGFLGTNSNGIVKSTNLDIAHGGTGRTTEATGITNLGKNTYAGLLTDNTELGVTGILPVSHGGTGRDNLNSLKTDMSLNNVDNTSDINKPVSNATQTAIDNLKTSLENQINTVSEDLEKLRILRNTNYYDGEIINFQSFNPSLLNNYFDENWHTKAGEYWLRISTAKCSNYPSDFANTFWVKFQVVISGYANVTYYDDGNVSNGQSAIYQWNGSILANSNLTGYKYVNLDKAVYGVLPTANGGTGRTNGSIAKADTANVSSYANMIGIPADNEVGIISIQDDHIVLAGKGKKVGGGHLSLVDMNVGVAWDDVLSKPSTFPPSDHNTSKITSGILPLARGGLGIDGWTVYRPKQIVINLEKVKTDFGVTTLSMADVGNYTCLSPLWVTVAVDNLSAGVPAGVSGCVLLKTLTVVNGSFNFQEIRHATGVYRRYASGWQQPFETVYPNATISKFVNTGVTRESEYTAWIKIIDNKNYTPIESLTGILPIANGGTGNTTGTATDSTKWAGKSLSIVTSLPSNTDANTIYFITDKL